jgi:aryl-alcohol dehydrogenase-like predicted oxidoreductase
VLKRRGGARPFVATKTGREGTNKPDAYNKANITRSVEGSLKRLQVDALDLIQLHCPHPAIYYMPEVFDILDGLKKAGKLRTYGVSVEKVEEGLKAIEYPGVAAIQIIYNIFRQRPERLFFPQARSKGVAVIVRVPLASGLLSGRMTRQTKFAADDHRTFNREGESFDKGETFSGVPYEVGLDAVEELKKLVPAGASMAQFALRWILMADAVTVVIPGAKNKAQAEANSAAASLPALSAEVMAAAKAIYDTRIARYVDQLW